MGDQAAIDSRLQAMREAYHPCGGFRTGGRHALEDTRSGQSRAGRVELSSARRRLGGDVRAVDPLRFTAASGVAFKARSRLCRAALAKQAFSLAL